MGGFEVEERQLTPAAREALAEASSDLRQKIVEQAAAYGHVLGEDATEITARRIMAAANQVRVSPSQERLSRWETVGWIYAVVGFAVTFVAGMWPYLMAFIRHSAGVIALAGFVLGLSGVGLVLTAWVRRRRTDIATGTDAGLGVLQRLGDPDDLLRTAALEGAPELLAIALRAGATLNRQWVHGLTALHFAVMGSHTEVVRLLLDAGADVNLQADERRTALHFAALRGDTEVARLLLEARAKVNLQADERYTPLHLAALGAHTGVVHVLVDAGADVNLKADEGRTALDLASARGHTEIVELLREHGAKE